MVDISDDTKIIRHRGEVTGVVRRRRWSAVEKGRIVAEAIAPGAVIADVARRHDLVPQHLGTGSGLRASLCRRMGWEHLCRWCRWDASRRARRELTLALAPSRS